MFEIIATKEAHAAIGPYSQAIMASGQKLLFISGQIPLNPQTMEIVSSDVREQTRQVLKNLQGILAAAGATSSQVVKTTVFIKNMEDFSAINQEYQKYFEH